MKVGFVLLSNSKNPQPSTRVTVINMLPYLRAAGVQAEIVFDPAFGCETPDLGDLAQQLIVDKFDLVYFQKVHGSSVQLCVKKLSEAGISTIHGVCDLVDPEMAKLTNLTLVVTDFLKQLYPEHLRCKIRVVHDGIECAEAQKEDWGTHFGSRFKPIRAILVSSSNLQNLPVLGTPPSWLQVTIVGRYPDATNWGRRLREAYWEFQKKPGWRERIEHVRFLMDTAIETQKWQAQTVHAALKNADIGIIPIESSNDCAQGTSVPLWRVKSENRLTLKMAVGLPVISTPIPSYLPIVDSGKNGFLANSRNEWLSALEILRDPEVRRAVGQQARTAVIDRYSMQEQSRLLLLAIQSVVTAPRAII